MSSVDSRYHWTRGTPRTEVNCTPSHCIYDKLWYNNGRFYLLVDGDKPVVSLSHDACHAVAQQTTGPNAF